MDSTNTTTNDLPLERLVALAAGEVERLGYGRRTRHRFRATWRRLVMFARDNDLGEGYSEELATQFLDAYRPPSGERLAPDDHWRRRVVYDVRMLGDFSRDGRMVPFDAGMITSNLPQAMKKPLEDYQQYCRDRLHLRQSTLAGRTRQIALLLDFLAARGVRKPEELQPADVTAFIVARQHLRPKTISRIVSDLRQFFRFLAMRGTVHRDFSHAVPAVRTRRDASIPSAWEPEHLARLLAVVDRSSARGKRDYAIMLLAARLGLRTSDIRTLRLDDLDWDAATLTITQSKTGAPLQLPITEEVGEALIDYLRFGRGETERRDVFLKLWPPFEPLRHPQLVVAHWRQLAGIECPRQRSGLHPLRHTLATQLLREQTPVHVIADILGHATTQSTMIYAKADTEALRGAALDTEGTHDVE
ncbi:MAG: site-specific integrase [Gammaproteobacteria bacterium]|nr:site-specific integrase [Gammaproteobacteria bacterium]